MIRLFCVFLAVIWVSDVVAQTREVSATDPALEYVGRFDFSNPSKPAFMYTGCTIRAGFTGTSMAIKLTDDSLRNWFTVKVDDSLFSFKADRSDGVYSLAKNLPDKKHTLEIFRRTEWHGGTTRFEGLFIDEGKKVYPLVRLKRTVEFIGNSLTCGYGNEGKNREEHFTYETENGYEAYGALIARSLQANYVAVCRSGIGMYQSYGGDQQFAQTHLYEEIVVGSRSAWNYTKHQVDVVVIELGSNDLEKPLDSAAFTSAYVHFVKRLRGHYPRALIICAAGPEDQANDQSKFQSYVKSVTDELRKLDKGVHYFYFGIVSSHGSDWHPNLEEHKQMAAALLPYIKRLTGW